MYFPVLGTNITDGIWAHSDLIEVTRTEPLREFVWESRKDPDHERQMIYDGGNKLAMASAPIPT
jgi:hypothetical protein